MDSLGTRADEAVSAENVIWKPQSGSQRLFLSCTVHEVLNDGTRGSMKTDSLIMDFTQHVGQGFGPSWRGVLFRQSYPQLSDIVARTKKWFRQIFPGQAEFNKNSYTWEWKTGEALLLRYMNDPDDYWNYHGHEYPWIGWEELTNWAAPDCYEAMKTCNRSSDSRVPRKYRANCNPLGPGHNWVKAYFVDPAPVGTIIRNEEGDRRVRIHSDIEENQVLLRADPGYLSVLNGISDPNKKKAWRFGSWDITSGGALDDVWDRDIHVLSPFEIPAGWYVDRTYDWGSSKPFSVGWWAESDGTEVTIKGGMVREKRNYPSKTLFRIGEMYGWNGEPNKGCRMTSMEVARRIREVEQLLPFYVHPGPADNTIFEVSEGRCIADDMATLGVMWTRSNKGPGSRVTGLEKVRERLIASAKRPMEEPGLFVFENCIHFIRTVPTLPRDPKKIDDVDTTAEDHIWDETRYRVLKQSMEMKEEGLSGL